MHKIWIIWKYFGHVCSITNTGQSCIIYCSVYNGLMYSMTQYLLYKIASHRCIEGYTPKKNNRMLCIFVYFTLISKRCLYPARLFLPGQWTYLNCSICKHLTEGNLGVSSGKIRYSWVSSTWMLITRWYSFAHM